MSWYRGSAQTRDAFKIVMNGTAADIIMWPLQPFHADAALCYEAFLMALDIFSQSTLQQAAGHNKCAKEP